MGWHSCWLQLEPMHSLNRLFLFLALVAANIEEHEDLHLFGEATPKQVYASRFVRVIPPIRAPHSSQNN
jgi:hypothetical protein